MNNDPASLTDPNGLKVGETLTMMGWNTGPPRPLWVASWMDKEWIGILSYLMGDRMGWYGGNSEAIWQKTMSAAMAHGNNTGGGGDGAASSPINIEAGTTCNYNDYTNSVSDPDPEMQDWKFWEDKDKNPNKGNSINLPPIDQLLASYPLDKKGNKINLRGYSNECAIRWSYTLRLNGVDISSAKKFDDLTTDGLIRMADNSALWFADAFGPPITGSAKSKYGPMVLTPREFQAKYSS